MLGVLYLLICITTGYVLCTYCLPDLEKITETTYRGKAIRLNRGFVLLPAWFVSGTLVVTWTSYLLAYLFQNQMSPLAIANGISMSLYAVVSLLGIWLQCRKKLPWNMWNQRKRLTAGEIVFLIAVIYLVCRLMWRTFFVAGGTLYRCV